MNRNEMVKNQGMSLVELLVSVAVLGLAMVGILALMNASARYFSSSNREVEVQQELQTTFAMVSNMISEANSTSKFTWSSDSTIIRGKKYAYAIVKSGSKLYAKEFNLSSQTPTTSITGNNDENLLADHVDSFNIITTNYDDGYVTLSMKVKYGSREAAMTKNIFMRNSGKERVDFLGQCDATAAAGSGRVVTFDIKQNTGAPIAANTSGVICVKIAAGNDWTVSKSGVSVTSCTINDVSYNRVSGTVTIYVKSNASWAAGDAGKITVSLTLGGSATIARDKCRVISISK